MTMELNWYRQVETAIGTLTIGCNTTSVTLIGLPGETLPAGAMQANVGSARGVQAEGDSVLPESAARLIDRAAEQLQEYLAGQRREFDLPWMAKGTPFQEAVWQALYQIPYGVTCSYADIARAIGRPKACRAVGQANHRNPIAIVVPCHRVIGRDGTLTGYGGGLELKRRLLALEQAIRPE